MQVFPLETFICLKMFAKIETLSFNYVKTLILIYHLYVKQCLIYFRYGILEGMLCQQGNRDQDYTPKL